MYVTSTLQCRLNSFECETKASPFISRRNCVIVHGMLASDDAEHALVDLFGRTLGVPVGVDDIDRCHRLEASVNDKPRAIIVKFEEKNKKRHCNLNF